MKHGKIVCNVWTRTVLFLFITAAVFLGTSGTARAVLNHVAIYRPDVAGQMTTVEQQTTAEYILNNVNKGNWKNERKDPSKAKRIIFAGYDQETVNSLTSWLNHHMYNGKSDVLIIIDLIPAMLFQGENEGSLAEQWMDNGNLLLWTGSEPFAGSIDTIGAILTNDSGAAKALDVSTVGLCTGTSDQVPTTAVADANASPPDPDGDYNISAFVAYTATHAMNYGQLLIDAQDSAWDRMSDWKIDEIFSEDTEEYLSDNIVLVNGSGGQFGQFYTGSGLNDARQQVITQILNNWVALSAKTLIVPDDYGTIQAALDAAQPRDTVLVRPGVYNEQLDLKTAQIRGVKIVSDDRDGGNDFVTELDTDIIDLNIETCAQDNPVMWAQWKMEWQNDGRPGYAETYGVEGVESKKVMKRAARTIIYGTGYPDGIDGRPMVDFALGSTVGSLLDGFTVCAMPQVNHEIPGHSHVIQTRGASATVVNNIVYNNGSSGLGSHAWFFDQENPDINDRDFRFTNIQYEAHPILINNVVFRNEGNNLGNNHYSYAIMYNNELFESISIDDHASPAIGCQHGAHPFIMENLVYKSSWVGIGGKKGIQQGKFYVNRPTHPTVMNNIVFDAGQNDLSGEMGAGIGAEDTGGWDPKTGQTLYHIINGNSVSGARNAAIGIRSTDPAYTYDANYAGEYPYLGSYPDGFPAVFQGQWLPADYPPDLGYVRITNNTATGGGQGGMGAGIGLNGAHGVEISGNTAYGNNDAGIGIRGGGRAELIDGNTLYNNNKAGLGLTDNAVVGVITNNVIEYNGLAGIGMDGVTVTEVNNNTISANGHPGIAVINGTAAGLISGNVLDGNGTAHTTGFIVSGGSSAVIADTTIQNSGMTNLSVFDAGTTVSISNSSFINSGQHGAGPNITVGNGAQVTVEDSLLDTTIGSPNINVSDPGTVFTMVGGMVTNSAKPGMVTNNGPTIILRNTVFDHNGYDLTAGMLISNSTIDFDGVVISNTPHWNFITNCTGIISNSDFHLNSYAGGGQLLISGSTLDFIGNLFHDPAGFHNQIRLQGGSHLNFYHNTIMALANGGVGPYNFGPGDGLSVDGTSSADVRNNIFSNLPRAITVADGGSVTASTNAFYMIRNNIFYGENQIHDDPQLEADYNLQPTSPLIDAGERIPGVNDDYIGAAPDVGAFEYGE